MFLVERSILNLEHGTTFETALWLKVEVEARPLAGTGPTAGRFEPATGNGNITHAIAADSEIHGM